VDFVRRKPKNVVQDVVGMLAILGRVIAHHHAGIRSKHGAWREHSDRATNWVVVLAIKMPREIAGTLPQMKALGVG
jgi:uncharacterized membrane protein